MENPELYNTYNTFEELEQRKFQLPGVSDAVVFRACQLLLGVCTNEKGEWLGGNPFFDLETILAILRDDKEHAENFLEPPERARTIKRSLELENVFIAIRDQLVERFRQPGRE